MHHIAKVLRFYSGKPKLGVGLLTIIALKIVFLSVFWVLVLKPQVTHVGAAQMQHKLIPNSINNLE